jgi:hypothetical protein
LRLSASCVKCECRPEALPPNLPHAAQAHQRYPRRWRCASFTDLIEQRAAVDKVAIAAERHEAGRLWWSLGTFCAEERD